MTEAQEHREAIITLLLHKAPNNRLGRTQVMKLCYFLQVMKDIDLGYDFRLFTYGPYDIEVLNDLASCHGQGFVEEVPISYSSGKRGYVISLTEEGKQLLPKFQANQPDLVRMVDDIVTEFGGSGASELELLSTIIYVDREFSENQKSATVQEIVNLVHSIKPHFDASSIEARVQKMASKQHMLSLGS
jgi:uncharacterized protein